MCLEQPSPHHLEILAPPQRAASPKAKEIPKLCLWATNKAGVLALSLCHWAEMPTVTLALLKPCMDDPKLSLSLPGSPNSRKTGTDWGGGFLPSHPLQAPGQARTSPLQGRLRI